MSTVKGDGVPAKPVRHPVEFIGEYDENFINEVLLPCIIKNLPEDCSYYANPDNDQFVWQIRSGFKPGGNKTTIYADVRHIFYLCSHDSPDHPYDWKNDPLKAIASKIVKELNLTTEAKYES